MAWGMLRLPGPVGQLVQAGRMRRSYHTHFSLVNGGHRGNLVYGYVAGNPCMPVIAGGTGRAATRALRPYVCPAARRDRIPRRIRAQLRGSERYTEAHEDEGVQDPDGHRL